MSGMCPCKGCTERHTACHGSCEAYKNWLDMYHAEKKHLEEVRTRWHTPWSPSKEATTRRYGRFTESGFKQGGMQ